ncbi:aminomethyl-transferring glycine dehydrogenase [Deltaproteobacteria bacterium TL4]
MTSHFKYLNSFKRRHIGPNPKATEEMLRTLGSSSLEELIAETLPEQIRLTVPVVLPEPVNEQTFLSDLRKLASKNKTFNSFIGLGYYNCVTPPVIQRNIFENPGWYTQYTPYQAEISQGRLEALLNFQTAIMDLTKMEIANASLLDEGTSAAEAMGMLFRIRNKRIKGEVANQFLVSESCFPQTIELIKTRAEPLDIEVIVGDHQAFEFTARTFGAMVQYPAEDGNIHDYQELIQRAHHSNALVVFASDLLSLTLLTPPGELGADVAIGSTQRFGIPLGFGGPHAAYFATHEKFIREAPGRIIGVSVDRYGHPAYRMAIQTREQHIKRDKATSNICTAQALLAIMAGMYAVYHGPEGLKAIAQKIHSLAQLLETELSALGYKQLNPYYFDTLKIQGIGDTELIKKRALTAQMNFRYIDSNTIAITLDETVSIEILNQIIQVFAKDKGQQRLLTSVSLDPLMEPNSLKLPEPLIRRSNYLSHAVFHSYHSESEMMRYIKRLENKDISLTFSMISLGSCTMKLNSATEMLPVTWPEFASIHPFAPSEQVGGYLSMIKTLEESLAKITGFKATSLQPNSGAQGEYAGLMVIRAYHKAHGDNQRNVILIPASAHGTNPASAAMSGMNVIVIKCDDRGNIDVEELREKAVQFRESLAGLMVTYPSTHGVFEEAIREICQIIHENGGLVYMDGANMNAQVGLTNPGTIGADVCHLNLHKTFAIPHGGGGPGVGPICVNEKLAPYLPSHPLVSVGGKTPISAISAAPWGSAGILMIAYAYIQMLGMEGLTDATRYAILNANYLKSRLENHYDLLYVGKRGRVAHEMILDTRPFEKTAGIKVEDIAKRLMDYGFHAPTISFPVPGTMMIEPTESESKEELDRFCEAMIAIREEIRELEEKKADSEDNVLINAPHTAEEIASDSWSHPYSREKAVYPLPFVRAHKFWVSVGRINNSYGDRNLICSCPPVA